LKTSKIKVLIIIITIASKGLEENRNGCLGLISSVNFERSVTVGKNPIQFEGTIREREREREKEGRRR